MKKAIAVIFLLFSTAIRSQDLPAFRYDKDFLNAAFHKNRREEVRKQMPDSSVAVLFSAPVRNRANDTYYSYHQNPNFYYLTGFTQPNAVLFLFKNPHEVYGVRTKEVLIIPPRDPSREVWTGRMASLDDARSVSGIDEIITTQSFTSLNISSTDFKSVLYLSLPSGVADSKDDSLDLYDLINTFKVKLNYPPANGDTYLLGNILKKLREVKTQAEISLLRKAVEISCIAHEEMMRTLKPGMAEYMVQAAGEFVFKNKGSEYVGYPSICGGGENSCVLHYETNRKSLKEGELILLDMGAEYHGYTADVTRTLPVSGKFSSEQKIIYDLVLQARDSALSRCSPGNDFRDPHKAAVEVIRNGLLALGIISEAANYKTYFMHGTSHYLGLDVHDAGTFGKLSEGNVITVEPGIYIPANSACDPKWWNIGIRIEDDVLITHKGHENLSQSLPVRTEEIEEMMKKEPLYFNTQKE